MSGTDQKRGFSKRIVNWMDRTFYPDWVRRWDDQALRDRVLAVIAKDHVMLDVGAGSGLIEHTNYRGLVKRVCGIDPGQAVMENPFLDEAHVAFAEEIPYPDNTFDVAVASNVLEHLTQPDQVFAEVARVLKPGGVFLAKTPNLRHYMPLVARVTPHWFHEFVVSRIFTRTSKDIFPTVYRANTPAAVKRNALRGGLEVAGIELIEDRPEYLRFSAPTYALGLAYERVVNNVPGMGALRLVMLVTFRKPGAGSRVISDGGSRIQSC